MEHKDTLEVRVGDLVPGTFKRGKQTYFPELDWSVFSATFRLLLDHPEDLGEDWPLFNPWVEMCVKRFGQMPQGHEDANNGRGWAWKYVESAWRRLAASFQKHGYKPSLISGGEKYRVYIEGDGTLCVLQGNKRVALMRMIGGLDYKIDVKVVGRADGWLRIKKGIYDVAGGKMDMYQPLDHPDFAGWTHTQPCCERLAMFEKELQLFFGSVLDLGCHTGWFCRAMFVKRCSVVGVDENQFLLDVAKTIGTYRRDGWVQPSYVNSDIETYLNDSSDKFDVCLYLSIAMHVFARRGTEGGWKQLDIISRRCKRMFMDIAFGGYSKHLPFTPDTLVEEVLKHTQFVGAKLLGRTQHENRPFYVFWT